MKKRWGDRCIGLGIGILVVLLGSILLSGRDTQKIVYKPIPTISIEMQQEEKEVVAEKSIPGSNGFGITDNVELPQDFVEELLIYEYIEYGIRKYNEDNQLDETYSVDIERNMLPYDTEFGMKDANAEPYKTDLAKEIIPELADNLYNFELIGQNGTIYMSIDTYSMKIYVYDTLQQVFKWEGIIRTEEYDEINKYSDKIAMVKNNGLCSYIDCTGKRITGRKFQEATSFWEGKAAVQTVIMHIRHLQRVSIYNMNR